MQASGCLACLHFLLEVVVELEPGEDVDGGGGRRRRGYQLVSFSR